MRETIETGKTIDEAIEKACITLGLPREEISIEVLETPQKKLFGSVPAKVRATAEGDEKPTASFATDSPEKEKKEPPKTAKAQGKGEEREESPYESEKASVAIEYIKEIAKTMGITNFTTEVVKRRDAAVIKVTGEEASPLIGRRGEAMEALTLLASLVANNTGGDFEKISVDINNYSAKREKDLIQLAKRVGSQVAKTGRSHNFEPMNSYERRIIHSVISEMNGVKSESFGEAQNRHIVITSTRRGGGGGGNYKNKGQRPPYTKNQRPEKTEQTEQAEERDGKSPDAELIEKLASEGRYGKIDV